MDTINVNPLVLAASLASVLLTGCAMNPDRPVAEPRVRGSACVFESTVSSFQPLDSTRLIIHGSGRNSVYLAEVSAGCFDLQHRWALALVDGDHNGQICGFGRDRVAYRDGGRVEQCLILGLERLSPERLKALELKHGLREKDKPAAGEP